MKRSDIVFVIALISIGAALFPSCSDVARPDTKDIVKKPAELEPRVEDHLKSFLDYASANEGRISDSNRLHMSGTVQKVYQEKKFHPLYSNKGKWNRQADSLYDYISRSRLYGLFPEDYHFSTLTAMRRQLIEDSLAIKDAVLWSRADLLLTDALLNISRDLKQGRLEFDSIATRKDSLLPQSFYLEIVDRFNASENTEEFFTALEPRHSDYWKLRSALPQFLDSAQFKRSTYLKFPYKDSLQFYKALQLRLFELDFLSSPTVDTAQLAKALRQYQESKKLKITGRINENTVNKLNLTDWERFKSIALTLDKYKLFPDTLPETYVWVNIPGYQMKVLDSDSVALQSKVIVGTPTTRTPELNSEISNFITYPQWTVPYSIVFKEMLPAIQKDLAYLDKQNLMVVDKDDNVIDPTTIDWSKLSKKKFPYQLKQRQGDDNSLGILKFNFRNKYAVYLHDTNARWLFGKSSRALSHGCVRVQKWKELAQFLVRNDTLRVPPDSLTSWIARQEKRTVTGFKKVPIYIRYMTCEGKDGKVVFYDDIYGVDRFMREKFFSDKSIN